MRPYPSRSPITDIDRQALGTVRVIRRNRIGAWIVRSNTPRTGGSDGPIIGQLSVATRNCPPTADEVRQFIEAADGAFRLHLELAAIIGARRGELVALQWGDINGSTIDVHSALAYTSASGVVETAGKIGHQGHRIVSCRLNSQHGSRLTESSKHRWRSPTAYRLRYGYSPTPLTSSRGVPITSRRISDECATSVDSTADFTAYVTSWHPKRLPLACHWP